jgi:hypothetical protein
MEDLLLLRERYGSVYVLTLPDGKRIPYKLLSVGDFLKYERLFKTGQYPSACLENEIFTRCVVDKILVDHMDQLKAGIVTSVATSILSRSGPSSIDHLNYSLDINREAASFAIHEMVSVVCQAFPAYKPDDLYEMEYDVFMLRLAQAERHLMRLGVLREPLSITPPGMEGQPQRPKVNADELFREWEDQQRATGGYLPPESKQQAENTIISKTEMNKPGVFTSGGAWDALEKPPEERQAEMVKATASIYNDYLEQMKAGQKVKVPSMEDRRAAALARAKANEEAYNVAQAIKKKKLDAELKEALAKRDEARAAKRRKKRR